MMAPTISVEKASEACWDVVVVGAGPAGCAAAIGLAPHRRRVLVVDAKTFPRPKVCGGCLNAKSIASLERLGVLDRLRVGGALPVKEIRLVCGRHQGNFPMPETLAVSRSFLDATLVERAIELGCHFLSGTSALVEPAVADEMRSVRLRPRDGDPSIARTRVVIAADGLGHPSLRLLPEFQSDVRRDSRIGVQAAWNCEGALESYPPGTLTMVAGDGGYVGLTFVEGGQINLAAALDPAVLSGGTRPEDRIRLWLERSGLPIPSGFDDVQWTGTPPLTRRSADIAGERLFLAGDATGYIEPFTGEGMAWAFAAGESVVPLALAACEQWSASLVPQWQQALHEKVVRNQWMCRLLAEVLRRPRLAGMFLEVCRWAPIVPRKAMQRISGQMPPTHLAVDR